MVGPAAPAENLQPLLQKITDAAAFLENTFSGFLCFT